MKTPCVISFVVLLLCLFLFPAYSQSLSWTETQPSGAIDVNWNVTAVNSNGTTLIAGINGRRLYVSTNSGGSWTEVQPAGNVDKAWYAASISSDGSVMIAGAYNGRLHISTDTGNSWSETQPAGEMNRDWFTTSMSADGTKLIAGAYLGRLYLSTDGGGTWAETQPAGDLDNGWHTSSMSADGTRLIAGVYGGRLYRSTDSGTSWTETQPAGDADKAWFKTSTNSDGSTVLAAVNASRIYLSTTGGTSWAETQPAGNSDKSWTSTSMSSDGAKLIAGASDSRLYISSNGGASWTEAQPAGNADRNWRAASVSADGSKVIAGAYGYRLYINSEPWPMGSIQFGVAVLGTSVVDSVKMKNTATTLMSIDSVVSDNASFATSQGDTIIAGGDSVFYSVTFAPTTAGPTAGTLKFYHDGSEWPLSVSVSGTGLDVEPTEQASNLGFTDITTNAFTISWDNGNGSNRIVLIRHRGAVDVFPEDATLYMAHPEYGFGSEIGIGNFVVYAGSDTSVRVTGLTHSADYYVAVMEYNGPYDNGNYLTTSPLTGMLFTHDLSIWSKDTATLTFTKADYADFTDCINQDRMSDSVWITRGNTRGLFNIRSESASDSVDYVSPIGTEWAIGTTANIGELTFAPWGMAVGWSPLAVLDQDMVVHLIAEGTYIDIKFLSWTQGNGSGGGQGGGFSYVRAAGPLEIRVGSAIGITGSTATLNGGVLSLSSPATAYALFGSASGVYTDSVLVTPNTIDPGTLTTVAADIAGLQSGTTYFFCIAAENDTLYKRSAERSFTTGYDAGAYALRFDGNDDYVELPISASPTAYTVEMWVKPAVTTNANIFVRTNGDPNAAWSHQLRIVNGVFEHYLYDDGVGQVIVLTGTTAVVADRWYHVAIALDEISDWVGLYVDGVQEAASIDGVHTVWREGTTYLLGSGGGGLAPFQGTIDEVRIWDHFRSESERRESMHRSLLGTEFGLTGYWRLNENGGTTAGDLAANAIHGTLNNFNFNASSGHVVSTAPLGVGMSASISSFTSGTATLGELTLETSDPFDSPVTLVCTRVEGLPQGLPGSYPTVADSMYCILNVYGSPGTFSVDLSFDFGPGVIDSRGDSFPAGILLYKRSSTSESAWTLVGTADSVASASGIVRFAGITSFSQFAVIQDETALPVELVALSAVSQGTNVELKWKTATEVDNAGWEVERRNVSRQSTVISSQTEADGWVKVGFVEGVGTASSPHEYSFTDAILNSEFSILNSRLVYRLKQIDRSGSFSYSHEAEVEIASAPRELTLDQNYPNPFNPVTTIDFTVPEDGTAIVRVYDMLGREIATLFEGEVTSGRYMKALFDASQLPSGVYVVRLDFGNKQLLRKMVLMK